MTRAVILIFLGGSPDAYDAELEAWARARLVQLEKPEAAALPASGYPAKVVEQIELALEAARLSIATLDDAAARARLAEAERLLRGHPELPQAAWLMAERWDLEASSAERSPDAATRAAELHEKRDALEPARAAPYSPNARPSAPSAEAGKTSIVVKGLAGKDRLFWNGIESDKKLSVSPGEHHVRVLRRGRLAWAGWVRIEASARQVVLPVPAAAACSLEDLGPPSIVDDRVLTSSSTRCERWAVARPAASGGIEIASCSKSHCGALLSWKKGYGALYEGPPQPRAKPGFPVWASVALASAGAVVIGGVVAWRAGAFDEPAPNGPRWRFYGP
jgi:hypothetical protein